KLHSDINAILLYDGPLIQAGQNPSPDLRYLFYRSLVNICSPNSFDSTLSTLSSTIVNHLPQSVLSKVDRWNRIHANMNYRDMINIELPNLCQKGLLFDVPLIELPADQDNFSTSSSSSSKSTPVNYVYHFSSFMNDKY